MSLTTGPFLMWVFLTLIGTEILKMILRFSGATEDAWFMPSTRSAVMTAATYLSYGNYGFDRSEFTLTVAFAGSPASMLRRSTVWRSSSTPNTSRP